MRPRLSGVLVMCAVLAGLSACDSTKELLGQGKRSPDEFAVYSRAPLSVPPDYGLRPPGTSAPGWSEPGSPTSQAREALIGSEPRSGFGSRPPAATGTQDYSAGTMALLERTGALRAEPNIRDIINRETTILADSDKSFTERLMFWGTPSEYGTVIDAEEEAKRIRENQALGKPITEGRTPTIARRKRALLEGIIN